MRLDALTSRLPAAEERRLSFGWSVFLVHLWAYFSLLDSLPAWLLRLNAWDLLGLASYVLSFALLESLAVWVGVLLVTAVLPSGWMKHACLWRSSLLLLTLAGWALLFHFYYGALVLNLSRWPVLLAVFALSLGLFWFLGARLHRWEAGLRSFLGRVLVLAWVYVCVDLLAMGIVLWRNVF